MWEYCGMARNEKGLEQALERIPTLREEFWENVNVPGERRRAESVRWKKPAASPTSSSSANCMCLDALERRESCGGHFREEYPDPGRRSAARRREFRARRRVGISPATSQAADPQRRAARLSKNVKPCGAQLQVMQRMNLKLKVWRQKDAQHAEGSLSTTKRTDISR